MRTILICCILFWGVASQTSAQTTGGVFGPDVDPGERSWELRMATTGEDDSFAARLHYQQAINGALRWRVIGAGSIGDTDQFEFRHVQGELLWQIVEAAPSGYSSALRFDARLSEGDDRSHQLGLNWTNQWNLSNGWRVRAIALLDQDVGQRSRDGVFMETRFGVSRRLEDGWRVGLNMFNDFGNSENPGSFNDQEHRAGPDVSLALGDGWSLTALALFGLSDAADDADLQFRIARDF